MMTEEAYSEVSRNSRRIKRSLTISLILASLAFVALSTSTSSAPPSAVNVGHDLKNTSAPEGGELERDKVRQDGSSSSPPIRFPSADKTEQFLGDADAAVSWFGQVAAKERSSLESLMNNTVWAAAAVDPAQPPIALEPQTSARNVSINFDELLTLFNPVEVGSLYRDVRFSSSGLQVYAARASNTNDSKSPPNCVTRGNLLFLQHNNSAEFVVDFPKPVNNLRFYITGVNTAFGSFALLDWYQDGQVKQQNAPIGTDGQFVPKVLDFSGFPGITKVRVHGVTDHLGVTFDDFTFTVPAETPTPTPTPSPTPTPPPAPTNLKATADEEVIDLQWSASQGATGYVIKRTNNPLNSSTMKGGFATATLSADNPTEFNVLTVLTSNTTSFRDVNITAGVRYDYVVAAVGTGGTSPDSQPVWAIPLPKNGCSFQTVAPVNQGNDMFVHGGGWSMKYNITPNDGLVLRDIALNGRRMAARISVPYFVIETQTTGQSSVRRRGELMPEGFSEGLRIRLIDQVLPQNDDPKGIIFHVVYAVDQMPGTPKACLLISQDFQFFPPNSSQWAPPDWPGACEPSGRTPDCAKFRPMIHYQFNPGNENESLRSIHIPQRHHYEVGRFGRSDVPTNRAGLFTDADGDVYARAVGGFETELNPVEREIWARGIRNGRKPTRLPGSCVDWSPIDNMHQTWKDKIKTPPLSPGRAEEPGVGRSMVGPGCPECVHMHWRWGDIQVPVPFGQGVPLLYPPGGTNEQASLDIAVVKWINGEEDPQDYFQTYRCDGKELFQANDPPVFWYAASSSRPDDYMFWHTAWFKSGDPNASNAKQSLLQSEATLQVATQDGPLSIDLGDVFEPGENHVAPLSIGALTGFPPLPPGYVALNHTAYEITTHAVATGPVSIEFGAASITDETTFNNLRVFHAEANPFDPEAAVWIDRTVLPPNSPSPSFSTRILTSKTDDLGVYVIGKLVQVVPPSLDRVNLSVTSTDGPDPVMAGRALTYTITVTNAGPQTAHNVALRDELPGDVVYDSATASQGSCKEIERKAYCNLNTLNVGASVTVTLKVRPRHLAAGNYEIENSATVRAAEQDDNTSNDTSVLSTTVLPDPNNPPTVVLTTASGPIVTGPASVALAATATDIDGTIAKVDFFDHGEFIGAGISAGGGKYTFTATLQPCDPSEDHHDEEDHHALPCGTHALVAIATDNGGRSSVSNSAVVFVNGAVNVNITSPASGLIASPGGGLTLTALATNSAGSIKEVEFFANGVPLGHAVGSGSQYSLSWTNLPAGKFNIVAVARDDNDVPSRSGPVTISVGTAPVVSLLTPLEGTTFPSSSNIGISASAISTSTSVSKVEFYADGLLIGTDSGTANNRFLMTWRQPADGKYSLTAVATDALGLTSTSLPVNIGVNAVPSRPGEVVWFDDAPPEGALRHSDGDGDWDWVDANPGAFSGTKSHQSRNFKQVQGRQIHSHSFFSATKKMRIDDPNWNLFTYVFLDINSMPRQIMLEWKDASGWEHRAYWGANNIPAGIDGTGSRYYAGPLPKPGQWTRLEVPAWKVGFTSNGHDIDGMGFVLDGGRATWDFSGKSSGLILPPKTPAGDTLWVDGALPPGAVPATTANDGDVWDFRPCTIDTITTKCHWSITPKEAPNGIFREHLFTGAAPRYINPGDILFTHVKLDPTFMPDQIVIQWYDGRDWHRAYWGINHQQLGTEGTENWRYMGGLPKALEWVRLEVPASYVGLENKYVSGMSFGQFRRNDNGQVIWGQSGQSNTATTVVPVLSPMTAVYQFRHNDFGYYYSTKSIPLNESTDSPFPPRFYVHPNQAPGTLPMFRFVNANGKREFFYAQCIPTSPCPDPNVWQLNGIAFYAYPNDSTPGVVPLHLYHERTKPNHYYLTINQNDVSGLDMVYDRIWAYVHATNPLVPARPYMLRRDTSVTPSVLNWLDSSSNEDGFRIELRTSGGWEQVGTVGKDVTQFVLTTTTAIVQEGDLDRAYGGGEPPLQDKQDPKSDSVVRPPPPPNYRVVAFNNVGDSEPSNETSPGTFSSKPCRCMRAAGGGSGDDEDTGPAPQSDNPIVDINSPLDGQAVTNDFAIIANAFDADGNGTLTKTEFYDGAVKLGEINGSGPYQFAWKNAPSGPHTLTVVATDAMGKSTISAPVRVTVTTPPVVNITSPTNGSVLPSPGSISLQATATDADGAISKVDFFHGETKIGQDTTSPYAAPWNSVSSGTYQVTARATDNAGMIVTSPAITLIVNDTPTISLSVHAGSGGVAPGGNVLLLAEALDADGTITKVDFYRGTTLIGTTNTFPFIYNWTTVPSGIHNLTAVATDNRGTTKTSTTVTLTVNALPTVSITSPVNRAMLAPGSNIVVNANASDDGSVSKVEFYQGSALIGTDTTAPYSVTWPAVAAGFYNLTAKATDN
ncbi:MAG TPA: Ig-like domain-containing protein, partial [Pyrinomonadaceae bacterium]